MQPDRRACCRAEMRLVLQRPAGALPLITLLFMVGRACSLHAFASGRQGDGGAVPASHSSTTGTFCSRVCLAAVLCGTVPELLRWRLLVAL